AIRWSIVACIVALAVVMNAPVWFVIAHVDVVGGSGGYDRATLIDVCIRHIRDWWLIGTNQNGGWGYDMWDMSNQFIAEAETGGLFALVCFVAIISKCFGRLGTMRRRVKPDQQWLFWCLGSVMLAHIFAFFGVAYWDQTQIWWFALLAMICAVTASTEAGKGRRMRLAAVEPAMRERSKEPVPEIAVAAMFSKASKLGKPWGGPQL
ncbi:MAG TPA: hypothetical protein VFW73_03850, partial [Lacipirellulaceae bacterium]|nr:hypothetical protein [Lacipirellulaceae bacterium]